MRYLQGNHDGRAAFVNVAIVDAAKYREHRESRTPILSGVKPFKALIDTGATSTMISKNLVSELSLEPATKLEYHSKDGPIWTTAYLFRVAFYDSIVPLAGDPEEDGASLVSNLLFCPKVIMGGEIENQGSFDVLLGMDVITTGKLTISSDGTFDFIF